MTNWLWRCLPLAGGLTALGVLGATLEPESWSEALAISPLIVLAAIAVHALSVIVDGVALQTLFGNRAKVSLWSASLACWVSQSVGRLMPATQIGAEIVKIRVLLLRGAPPLTATAASLMDAVLGLLTLVVFFALGLSILASLTSVGIDANWTTLAAAAAILAGLGAALRPERAGRLVMGAVSLLETLRLGIFARRLSRLLPLIQRFDRVLERLLRQRKRCIVSAIWRFIGWVVGAGEVWVGLKLLGFPVSPATALALDAAIQAARAVGFFIPAAIGAQEAGILLFATLVGLPEPAAVGFAIVRRAREFVVGISGIACWQFFESRRPQRRRDSPMTNKLPIF